MLKIGEKLRDARTKRGLSLRKLAAMTDVSASLLSQIENQKANPSVRTLHSLADALGVPVDAFFPERAASDADQMTQGVKGLTASQLRTRGVESLALDAGSGDFFATGDVADSPIQRAGLRPTIELQGDVVWERLTSHRTEGVEFMEIAYAPGATSGKRLSHHSGREFLLVLSGELTLELGFEVHTLRPGDSTFFESETPHRLSNKDTQTMRALSVILA